MCEAFLRMEPHVDFFRWMFSGRTLSVGNPPETALVGGFVLQKKLSAGGSYPMYTPCDSNRGWHREWFYIRKSAKASFPPFTGRRPERLDNWLWGPASWQKKKVEIIEAEL